MDTDSLGLARSFLGEQVTVCMDRPLGSHHPQHGFLYLVNYGYVPGVVAPDGDELDAYVLGVDEPLTSFTGRCIAIVHRLDDDDDKLVVVPGNMDLSDDEILAQTRFQERFFDSRVVRE
jgi:inorganic pyrophosphatase